MKSVASGERTKQVKLNFAGWSSGGGSSGWSKGGGGSYGGGGSSYGGGGEIIQKFKRRRTSPKTVKIKRETACLSIIGMNPE